MSFSSVSLKSPGTDDDYPYTKDIRLNQIVEKSNEMNDEPLDPRIQVRYNQSRHEFMSYFSNYRSN